MILWTLEYRVSLEGVNGEGEGVNRRVERVFNGNVIMA